ncbi:scarecrow-like protein 28 [Ananas comosus]|uniref:Scarecrow-like protein 28 n=1 Tax=Ananas comosus TaxID=4615 RepID=A0A6P5H509_ANACO|nr:scarecrow-like protein 28 [Ananas comosus]
MRKPESISSAILLWYQCFSPDCEDPDQQRHRGFDRPETSAARCFSPDEGFDRYEGLILEQPDAELVSLLVSCAESISSLNHEAVDYFLARLGERASPRGTTVQRVAAYFTEAFAFRAVRLFPHMFSIAPPRELTYHIEEYSDDDDDGATALRLFNYVSPIPKFLHFTLNERLLQAFDGKERVHVIDFDIKDGLQWPSLLQSLASRPNPPSHVRITGIGKYRENLQDAGVRLARFAEALNLPFKFHAVVERLDDVRLWMLHVKRDECIAVNCVLVMHKLLSDVSGSALRRFLELIRSTNPSIVLLGEQEDENNEQRWEVRFGKSLQYYSAIFDSLDSLLPENSALRIKVEEMFAREIRTIVAWEGSERVERHESFRRWREIMENGGFRNLDIGEREMAQSQTIVRMYSSENFTVERQGEGEGYRGLTLKWLDQPLYTVSAWAPNEPAHVGYSSLSLPT